MANVKYIETEKKTEDGEAIFHLVTNSKGRPPQFVKRGGRYIAVKELKQKAARDAKVAKKTNKVDKVEKKDVPENSSSTEAQE